MRESNTIKRFRRSLEGCEEDHVYSGTILEFDTEDYAPRNQFLEGMIITSKEGTRRVHFFIPSRNNPIIDVSKLEVNDFVQVYGRVDESRRNSTTPSLIMAPDKEMVIFARKREMFSWKGDRIDYVQALAYLISIILSVVSQISLFLSLSLFPSRIFAFQVGVVSTIFLIITIGVDWYRSHLGRQITVQYDNENWELLTKIVSNKFGPL